MGVVKFGMVSFPRHEADEVSVIERKTNIPNGTKPTVLRNWTTTKLCTLVQNVLLIRVYKVRAVLIILPQTAAVEGAIAAKMI